MCEPGAGTCGSSTALTIRPARVAMDPPRINVAALTVAVGLALVEILLGLDAHRPRRDRALFRHPLGARTNAFPVNNLHHSVIDSGTRYRPVGSLEQCITMCPLNPNSLVRTSSPARMRLNGSARRDC